MTAEVRLVKVGGVLDFIIENAQGITICDIDAADHSKRAVCCVERPAIGGEGESVEVQ